MVSVYAYAKVVEQEAQKAAKTAASSQPEGTKAEVKPAVAIVHIEGQWHRFLALDLIHMSQMYINAQRH